MDILNWLYLVKKKFARDTVENPDKDLIVLGADVSFQKRGDKYQSYVVPFGSAVAELDGNILRTGIYDMSTNGGDYTLAATPIMTKVTDKIIDTPASPTYVNVDMQGWKVSASVDIDNGWQGDLIYMGSVEFQNYPFWDMMPWKTTGQVYTWNGSNDVYSTLGYGSLMYDDNSGNNIPVNCYIQLNDYSFPNGHGYDIYLVYDQADPSAQIYNTTVSFQYEFLSPTDNAPQFFFY